MDEHVGRDQVNASGFPFQIRVEYEVRASRDKHGWRSIVPEHRWIGHEGKTEGFIDLILKKDLSQELTWYMVVECKRVRVDKDKKDGAWVFLDKPDHHSQSRGHVFLTHRQYGVRTQLVWVETDYTPASPVCSYCVMPKQGDTHMLEKISNDLLDSLESLATNQLNIDPEPTPKFPERKAVYVPVIVTNTEPVVCQFHPSEVDLSGGILKEGSGKFEKVPFIRFRKSFTTRYATNNIPMSLEEANEENERTICVVHAPSFSDFLVQWDIG